MLTFLSSRWQVGWWWSSIRVSCGVWQTLRGPTNPCCVSCAIETPHVRQYNNNRLHSRVRAYHIQRIEGDVSKNRSSRLAIFERGRVRRRASWSSMVNQISRTNGLPFDMLAVMHMLDSFLLQWYIHSKEIDVADYISWMWLLWICIRVCEVYF